MPMIRLATLLLLLACAVRAEDDEVRFKPKTYCPDKAVQNRSYQASAYSPAKTASATSEKRAEPSRSGFWGLFKAKPLDQAPRSPTPSLVEGKPFTQQKHITVPTITPDRKAMADRKPFIEGDKKLESAGYTAPEKTHEKNPLLAPRQGIKEPQ